MKIVFFGTPDIAVPVLQAVAAGEHEVLFCVTQPDRPAGRKMEITPPAVKTAAVKLGIPVMQPEKVKDRAFMESYLETKPDLNLIMAFGQIIPDEIIYHPVHHSINIHASLLPKYRGASPIASAILNGETETGITYQFIEKRLDAGDILASYRIAIEPGWHSPQLYEALKKLSSETVLEVINNISSGSFQRIKQDESKATIVKQIKKEDGRIDFSKPASAVINMVRAYDPWPSAYCLFEGKILKIYGAQIAGSGSGSPGKITEVISGKGFTVMCGDAAILVTEVQPEGKKRMPAKDFILGHHSLEGALLA